MPEPGRRGRDRRRRDDDGRERRSDADRAPHSRHNAPMAHFLFKEEPTSYSFDAFAKDGHVTWTGVKNPVAQKHLRSVKKGDLIFYYHTGDEKAVVGVAKATTDAYPDPADKTGKAFVVD